MMNTPRILIKLGGAALQEVLTLDTVTKAILNFRRLGTHVILVHGGGPAINEELRRRGIDWTFVGGQRVTSLAMMDTIESVLCGAVNGRVVRHMGAQGVNAVGFSGADSQTLLCTQASPELGQVGKIERVNAAWIEGLLQLPAQPVPVIAPIGVGAGGERFNVNADWAASHLAVALKVDELLFLTDQKGILDEEGQLISGVDSDGLRNMIDAKMVTGGMLTKTLAVLNALENGVSRVRVMRGLDVADDAGEGTFGTHCLLTSETATATAIETEPLHVAL
jgi:acetylglutamate kinase